MRHRTELPHVIDDVTTRVELPSAADYARSKIGELGRLTHRPVLHAHVKLTKHPDPAAPDRRRRRLSVMRGSASWEMPR
jgi:hypothetical protein